MNEEIKITAEIQWDPLKCCFAVDRPVYEGAVYFKDQEAAKGSPLAEEIFGLGNVSSVLISRNLITVTQVEYADWVPMAKQIGAAIRRILQSGIPPVSQDVGARRESAEDLRERVQELLDIYINPALRAHGGFVELIDVVENDVFLRLGGGCQGCGAASITLKQGVESLLREYIPELGNIFDTTDHAAGQNPYYSRLR